MIQCFMVKLGKMVLYLYIWFLVVFGFNNLLQVGDFTGSRPSEYGLAFIGPEGLLWK